MPKNNTYPLSGVRVIECATALAGPAATQLLADIGAEVIKVESPRGGETGRGQVNDAGKHFDLANGLPYHFENNNRNKKSIVVDLTREEGRQLIYSLVAKSAAFVQNLRPDAVAKLGIDYQTLRNYNPSLVYANCSGFGPKGPQAGQIAMQPVIDAATGLMLGIGEADTPPVHLPGGLSDQLTAMTLAYGIMFGLFQRERTGLGQELDVSMLGAMVWAQTNNMLYTLMHKEPRPRQRRTRVKNPLVNYYRCSDGRYIMFGNFRADRRWPGFCRALGLNELVDDPRFCNIHIREQHSVELIAILDKVFAGKTRDEWLRILASEDLIYGPIKDYWEVVNDPQVLENDYIVEFDHPCLGKIKEIGDPVKSSLVPVPILEPAPQLGQHTEQVLIDILGLSWGEISALREHEVIG